MILLCGIPSESSQARLAAALDDLGVEHRFVNQRRVRSSSIMLEQDGADTIGGVLEHDGWRLELDRVVGVYLRFMDDRRLPELAGEPEDSPARRACRAFHDLVGHWADVTPARVVNRYAAMGSNFSKPFQAQLIAEHGFAVPETLVTNDPALVRAFVAEHGRVIYKSISSERSIVEVLDEDGLARLEAIRWCPVQFQAFVEGTDVRVHTVGGEVFATAITSDATDYRYAARQTGAAATMQACELDPDVARRCLALADALGLDLAGIDLRLTHSGEAVCFEVNPSPVYSYYEAHTGQPMAAAIARYLAHGAS